MNELQPQKYRNSCLDRGLLVSLRDGELSPEETEQARAHLVTCPDCAADERSMQTASQEIYALFTLLGPSPDEIPETQSVLSALQSRIEVENSREESHAAVLSSAGSNIRFFQARKPQHRNRWWIAAAAAILIALLVLPNAGVLASQFLALFSVQHFQPISVNPQTFRDGIGEDLQSFGDVNINSNNLNSISHPTQAQIEQDLNFKLVLPSHLPPGVGQAMQFTLIDSAEGTFTFNTAKARTYLAQTGQSSVSIPSQLDGATFTITLAPGVIVDYGKQCQTQSLNVNGSIPGRISQASPAGSPGPSVRSQNGNGSIPSTDPLGCSGGKPFYIGEIPSPVIHATGKASLEDLRNFVLSLPKLTAGARVLLQNVNLSSGVVPLPIPPQIQTQQVTTHGVQGVLMTDSSLSLGAIIWQTHGIIYMVAGSTSDSTQLLNSANSLH